MSLETSATRSTRAADSGLSEAWRIVKLILKPFASLRLTVALFSMCLFLIWVGTIAQQDKSMWQVMEDYFHAWVSYIEFKHVFPRSFFIEHPELYAKLTPPGGFFFPGGITLGIALFANLLAAHLVRFTIQSRGVRLVIGLVVLALGSLICFLAIANGHSRAGLQGKPPVSWATLWLIMKVSMVLLWFVVVGLAVKMSRNAKKWNIELVLLNITGVVYGIFLVALFLSDFNLQDSDLRILWQLFQSILCGAVLLVGAALMFRKRSGIVVLHFGIGLLMFGELFVTLFAVEEQITLYDGETTNFARDIRSLELAVVDRSPKEHDQVTVVPVTVKETNSYWVRNKDVASENLPFDVEITDFYKNSELVTPAHSRDKDNPATMGVGLSRVAIPLKPGSGADGSSDVDIAALYAKLKDKQTGKAIGTVMLSQQLSLQDIPETVVVDGKSYDLYLRFKRSYKDYEITLVDARRDDYVGTKRAKNYSSDIRLVSPKHNFDAELRVWMNNPVRFAGETFYQSGHQVDPQTGQDISTLQVVSNLGWMIPYIACGIVMVGMMAHFCITLLRFLRRWVSGGAGPTLKTEILDAVMVDDDQMEPTVGKEKGQPDQPPGKRSKLPTIVAALLVGIGIPLILFGSRLGRSSLAETDLRYDRFAQVPVAYEGRVKPYDSVARSSLRIISSREYYRDTEDEKQPAIRWLLDVISHSDAGEDHKVFKIDNMQVQYTLACCAAKAVAIPGTRWNPG